jgi:tripartite-type tricarboxylate transporter receptor subunit TctC
MTALPNRRRALLGVLATTAVLPLALPRRSRAAAWPDRAVVWVVPFGPGGITDTMSRTVAQHMARSLGRPVLVENRAGASGIIGAESVARAAPDGYTILYGTVGTQVVQPALNPAVRYDAGRDFGPVHGLGASPNMLVVPASRPWRDLAGLVAHARRHPGALNYGSSGIGTSPHLCAVLLEQQAGIEMTHVPYANGSQAVTDLIGGRLDLLFDFPISAMPHVREGRLRALGVTDTERPAIAPEVPTMAEAGVPGVELTSWAGLFVPARTPGAVVGRLAGAAAEALRDEQVATFFRGTATTLWPEMGPEQLGAFVAAEAKRIRELLTRINAA